MLREKIFSAHLLFCIVMCIVHTVYPDGFGPMDESLFGSDIHILEAQNAAGIAYSKSSDRFNTESLSDLISVRYRKITDIFRYYPAIRGIYSEFSLSILAENTFTYFRPILSADLGMSLFPRKKKLYDLNPFFSLGIGADNGQWRAAFSGSSGILSRLTTLSNLIFRLKSGIELFIVRDSFSITVENTVFYYPAGKDPTPAVKFQVSLGTALTVYLF